MWDVCDQSNDCHDAEEAGLNDKLDRNPNHGGSNGAPQAQDSLRFDNITYKMQLPWPRSLERCVPPIVCNFEFQVTDRQDKLIMFKHSQEVREFVLTLSFRGLFVLAAFVSADGSTIYLQDRANKYNDFVASMGNPPQSASGNGGYANSGQNFARFYEIPFRNVLQPIANYIITEKAKKGPEFFA